MFARKQMQLEAVSTISIMDSHNHRIYTIPIPSSSSQDYFKTTHQELFISKLNKSNSDGHVLMIIGEADHKSEESGRERLKRHRVEMSGRVLIPDTWGQEDLLKNWIDCTVFDSALAKSSIMSAREALIQEARKINLS